MLVPRFGANHRNYHRAGKLKLQFCTLDLLIKSVQIRLTYAYVVGAAPWVKDDELHKEEQAVASNESDTIQTGSIFEDRVDEQEVEMELLWE